METVRARCQRLVPDSRLVGESGEDKKKTPVKVTRDIIAKKSRQLPRRRGILVSQISCHRSAPCHPALPHTATSMAGSRQPPLLSAGTAASHRRCLAAERSQNGGRQADSGDETRKTGARPFPPTTRVAPTGGGRLTNYFWSRQVCIIFAWAALMMKFWKNLTANRLEANDAAIRMSMRLLEV